MGNNEHFTCVEATQIYLSLRDEIFTQNIGIEDIYDDTFKVDIAATTMTTTTTVTPGQPGITGPEILITNEGKPVEGAEVGLECEEPLGIFTAVEQTGGKYRFEDDILGAGDQECELIVEKYG